MFFYRYPPYVFWSLLATTRGNGGFLRGGILIFFLFFSVSFRNFFFHLSPESGGLAILSDIPLEDRFASRGGDVLRNAMLFWLVSFLS